MNAEVPSETFVPIYHTTRRYTVILEKIITLIFVEKREQLFDFSGMGNENVDWIQLAWDVVPAVSYYGHGAAPWGSRKRACSSEVLSAGIEHCIDGRRGRLHLLKLLTLFAIKIIIYCACHIINICIDSQLSLFTREAIYVSNQNVTIKYNLFAWILFF
jgi:hypothetical protein